MDYKKDCEERLRKYAKFDETISFLEARLSKVKLHGKPGEIKAIDFSKIGHASMTSDAMQDLMEAKHIMNQINKVKEEKEIIDLVLNKIKRNNKKDYKFIENKYFKNLSIEETSINLGYSSSSLKTIYKIKDRALNNFCTYFWGE